MNVTIENYRGFEIVFNTESERFSFSADEGHWTEKQSYAACKKNVDEYLKSNMDFKPFVVRSKYKLDVKINIVGVRKDGRFTADIDGKKEQISVNYESYYILYRPEDDALYSEIKDYENQRNIINSKIEELKSKINAPSLKELSKKYCSK